MLLLELLYKVIPFDLNLTNLENIIYEPLKSAFLSFGEMADSRAGTGKL